MRRFLSSLALGALAVAGSFRPAEAQTSATAACEGYCGVVAVGCYIVVGLFVRDACGKMYEGCVDGCVAALVAMDDSNEGAGSP